MTLGCVLVLNNRIFLYHAGSASPQPFFSTSTLFLVLGIWQLKLPSNTSNLGSECTLQARALWGLCRFLHATDRPVVRLGEDFRLQALNGGIACLESYSSLAISNFQQQRLNYKVRPKWCLHLNKWIRFLLHFDFRDATTPKNLLWKTIHQECRYRKVVFSWKYQSNTKYQCAIPKSFALMPQHLSLTSTLFKYSLDGNK